MLVVVMYTVTMTARVIDFIVNHTYPQDYALFISWAVFYWFIRKCEQYLDREKKRSNHETT